MNVCYLAYARFPTEKAHGAQIAKTCEALARAGHAVELVIPGRTTAISEDAYSYYGIEKNFTLTVARAPDWVAFGSVGFALGMLWFSERAKFLTSFWKADVVYSRDAFVLLQYLLLGRPLVYEAHTAPTWLTRFVARRVKHVVVISQALKDAYHAYGVLPERITVAPDAIDPAPFETEYDKSEVRASLGIPNKVVALYVGKIDAAKGATTLAQASEHVDESRQIVLIGSGPGVEVLKRDYPKALFLHETPYRELPRVLAAADILVVPNSAGDLDASAYTSPLKVYAYLAAKKPIVASRVPALTTVLGDTVTYVQPDNPLELARALNDPITLSRVSSIKPYTWDERAEALLRCFGARAVPVE